VRRTPLGRPIHFREDEPERESAPVPQKAKEAVVKEPNWDAETYRLADEGHQARYGYALRAPGEAATDSRAAEPCVCCLQPGGACPRCDAPHEKAVNDFKGACCVGCAERDAEGDIVESEDTVWVFTFGGGHVHRETGASLRDRFVEVQAPDYETAHEEMFRHFGPHWGLNYVSREEAQVERFGLKLLPREEWPKPQG
jgi:hypothetical protein